MSNNFHYYSQKEWALNSALLIQDKVEETLRDRKECSIMLTGGESAKKLYLEWSKLKAFESLSGLKFFLVMKGVFQPIILIVITGWH